MNSDKKDPVFAVDEDDSEMMAAIAKARNSLPAFWEVFDKREHGESDFCLKLRITDKGNTEHFWLKDIERKDGKIFGTVNNDRKDVRTVKDGDRIEIPEKDISDWLYLRNGKMVGNYTIRVLFKQTPANEVARFKTKLAEP